MKKGKLHQTEHFLLKPGAKIPVFGGGWCVCGLMCNVGTLLIASLHPFLPPSHADNIKRCPNTSAFSPVLLLL